MTEAVEYGPTLQTPEEYLSDHLHYGDYELAHSTGLDLNLTHLEVMPDAFVPDTIGSRSELNWRSLSFEQELRRPQQVQEQLTDSKYKVYCLNRDYKEHGDGRGAIVFFAPLSSSPCTRQGQEALWQLTQRFPDRLILAVGNEGTSDTRISREWTKAVDPQVLAQIRRTCIEEALDKIGESPSKVGLIGQSMGGGMAFNVAKIMQEEGIEIDKLILVSLPVARGKAVNLVAEILSQEVPALIKRSSRSEKSTFLRHAGEVASSFLGTRSLTTNFGVYRKLVEIVANSRININELNPDIDISYIAGRGDRAARFVDFLEAGFKTDTVVLGARSAEITDMSVKARNILGVTAGDESDCHSSFLLNARLCGRLVETAYRWPHQT